jgi:hypothetical protein
MKQRSRKHPVKSIFRILGLYLLPVVAGILFLFTPVAQATSLNLELFDHPDIFSSFIDVTYDAGSDSFTASGFAMELQDNTGTTYNIDNGSFNIGATIDESGIAGPGTLFIGGTVSALGFNSGTLLKGTLTAFGFPDTVGVSDPFEFLFDVTDGDWAGDIGPVAGVILTNTDFGGSFSSNFANNGDGLSNTGTPVPEPATLSLLLLGGGGLCALRKRIGPKKS